MDLIRVEDGAFRLGGDIFRVIGANCYYLGFAPDVMVAEVLDLAAGLRLNTLRTWAFWHGDPDWTWLDRTIAWAEAGGIRLILTLVNYWHDFGGMAEWCARFGLRGRHPFYTDGLVRAAFRAHLHGLLGRENHITGRKYRDEPVILAWELANEPRCEGCKPEILAAWATEMSAVLKEAGARQPVSLGDEGFFRRRGARRNHLYNGSHGEDYEALLAIPGIDFATCHLYPEFEPSTDPAEFGVRWIREHIAAARQSSKPLVVEEYGIKGPAAVRDAAIARWIAEIESDPAAGSLLWMLAGHNEDGTPYFDDGYTVYRAHDVPSLWAHAERYSPGPEPTPGIEENGRSGNWTGRAGS